MRDHPLSSRLTLGVVALCCSLAFVLRLPALGRPSLSPGEQQVLAESQGLDPWGSVPEDAPVDPRALPRREGLGSIARAATTSPLYTTALASWTSKAGASERALRRPSAVAGVATVALVASIAALLAGPWAAGAAGLLAALSPIHVLASREAGPGAAALLLLASTLWLTLRADLDRSAGRAGVLGVLLGLCALGPPPLVGLAVLQLVWLAGSSRRRRDAGIVGGGALLVVALAWGGGLLRPPLADAARLTWVPGTTVLGVVRCAGASFTRVAGLEYHLVVPHARHVAPLTLLLVALVTRGASRLDVRRRWLLLGGAALPFALGAAFALWTGTVAPLQAHRMLPALPFLAVLTGVGLASVRRRPGWVALAVVVSAVAFFAALVLTAPPRETSPTRALVRTIAECRPSGTVVSVQRPLDLYSLAAWRLPGPLWLRSFDGPPPPDPSIRIEPSSACTAGIPSVCPGVPPCPSTPRSCTPRRWSRSARRAIGANRRIGDLLASESTPWYMVCCEPPRGRSGPLGGRTFVDGCRIIWEGEFRFPNGRAMRKPTNGRALDALAAEADRLPAVMRRDLRSGDFLLVTTRNSVYSLCLLEDGSYSVAGGWFDRQGDSPQRVGVNGCTFGGRAIKSDVVAAPGLFLEFENRVTTTRIREARVLRGDADLPS